MTTLIITQLLLSIIMFVAAIVAYEFYISRNGVLRKIMIANFTIEIFIYISTMTYVLLYEPVYSMWWNGILLPKAFIKLRLLYYLRTKK